MVYCFVTMLSQLLFDFENIGKFILVTSAKEKAHKSNKSTKIKIINFNVRS